MAVAVFFLLKFAVRCIYIMNYFLPILAVISGFVFVWVFRPEKQKNFRLLLAFSGAFLLSLTVFSMLPEIYNSEDNGKIGIFILLGVLLQLILEFFSKGVEHGHAHFHNTGPVFPWLIFISLCVHSLLEGFPVHHHPQLLYGIVIHKLPVAVILSMFLLRASIKKRYIVIFFTLFSLMTPAGTWLAEQYAFPEEYTRRLSALVAGIFLHVSTVILFETSEGHRFRTGKLMVMFIGATLAYLI